MSLLLALIGGAGPAAQNITGAGQVASVEAIGSPGLTLSINATGIISSEILGQPAVLNSIIAAGITTGETFGTLDLQIVVDLAGIASAEAFGLPVVSVPGAAWGIVDAGGIVSQEALGNPSVIIQQVTQYYGGSLVRAKRQTPHSIVNAGTIPGEAQLGMPTISASTRSRARRQREEVWLLHGRI